MTDPVRWSEDPNAPDGLRDLLRAAKPDEPSAVELGRMRGHVLAPKAALISAATTKIVLIGLFAVGAAVVHHTLARAPSHVAVSPELAPAILPDPASTSTVEQTAQSSPLAATPTIATTQKTAQGSSLAVASPAKQPAASTTTAQGSSLAVATPPKKKTPPSNALTVPSRATTSPAVETPTTPQQTATPNPTETPIVERTPEPIKPKPQLSEVALLEQARASLRSADATAALALADQAATTYPDGVLAEERDALAIEALIKLGRATAARAKWTQFASSYPHSNYRARLQHYF